MKLFSRELGDPRQPRLVVAHGLCGSGRNWLSTGEALAAAGFCVELLDLRDHGKSPWSERLDYAVLAEDFLEHWEAKGRPAFVFLGHSLGGKLGMALATRHAKALGGKLRGLCVVDIAPKTYEPHYQPALRACLELPLGNLANRLEADAALKEKIPNERFRAFLLTNLVREGCSFRWSCNFELILKDLPNLAENPLCADDRYAGPALFIAGSQSDFVSPADETLIRTHFPQAALAFLPTGHNVHIEAQGTFVETVGAWLKQRG